MNSSGGYTHSNYTVPTAVSTNRAKDSITYTYRGVSTASNATAPAGNAGTVTPTTANTIYHASYYANITPTFYYSNSTAGAKTSVTGTAAARYMNSSGAYTHSNFTVPTLTGETAPEGTVSYGWQSGTTTIGSATPSTASAAWYKSYGKALTIYYQNTSAAIANSATALYRNAYYGSATNYTKFTANSATGNSQATTVTLSNLRGTFEGINATANSTTSYAVNTTTIINSASTTYYAVSNYTTSVTATFYYWSGSAQTSTTNSANQTRYAYCTSSSAVSNSLKSEANIAVPSAVSTDRAKDSITYTYRGVSTGTNATAPAGNASTVTPTTANTIYHASYSKGLTATFYYSNSTAGAKTSVTSTAATRYMNSSGTYTNSNYTVPTLTGEAAPEGTVSYGWQSSASTIGSATPNTSSTTWYKSYGKALTIYYQNSSGGISNSATALYRNAYYGTATNYTKYTANSATGTTQATTVTLSSLRGTFEGINATANSTTSYAVNTTTIINSASTTYYAVSNYTRSVTANFYYSNSAAGAKTYAPASGTQTRYAYCTSASAVTNSLKSNGSITAPSLTGETAPDGTAAVSGFATSSTSLSTTTSYNTGTTAYYRVYSQALTINYPKSDDTVGTSTTALYRNAYYGSSTNYTRLTATSATSTTQATAITLSNIKYSATIKLALTKNTTTAYDINNADKVINNPTTTYYVYCTGTLSGTVTFYYYNGSAQTSTSVASTGGTYAYINSSNAVSSNGGWNSVTIPDAVKTNRSKDSVTFNYYGLSTNATSQTNMQTGTTVPGGNNTFYAFYSRTVTATKYVYNNSSSTATGTAYMNSSATVTNASIGLGTTTLSGYSPRHWSTSNAANASSSVALNGNASIWKDTTYYMSYTYTVTNTYYYYNGSSYTNSTATCTAYMGYTGSKTGCTPTAPTVSNPSGWSARGWSTSSGSSASTATPGTVTANTTYYYSWNKTVTISYNGNSNTGGSTSNSTGTAYLSYNGTTTNASISLRSNGFTRTGYTFSKWAAGSTSGTQYAAGASYSTASNTTMYAIWTANHYTMKYDYNLAGNVTPANGYSSLPTSSTFSTGWGPHWDRSFEIYVNFKIPTAGKRYCIICGYNGTAENELNIEVNTSNKLVVWIAGANRKTSSATLSAGTSYKLHFTWDPTNNAYSATIENTSISATGTYAIDGVGSSRPMKVGKDSRSNAASTFNTIQIHAVWIKVGYTYGQNHVRAPGGQGTVQYTGYTHSGFWHDDGDGTYSAPYSDGIHTNTPIPAENATYALQWN